MKLPQLNKNNSRLHVYIKGSVFSYPLYQDFTSMRNLEEYMQEVFNCKRKNFDYFYGE